MTVAREDSRIVHIPNGIQTDFIFPFRVDDPDYMLVYLDDVEITNWNIVGIGDPNGGVVTITPAPEGESVALVRKLPHLQNVDYRAYDAFPAETHELALDELTFQTQQHHDKLDRALMAPPSDNGSTDFTLPGYKAYNVLLWSPYANELINYDLRQCCDFGGGLLPPEDWGIEWVTAGASTFVDMDLNIYRSGVHGDTAMTNDEMSFNVYGVGAGAQIHAEINGYKTVGPITSAGANGVAHGWLSASGVANFLSQFDPSWAEDEYVQKAAVIRLFKREDVDGVDVDTPIQPSKTMRVTKRIVSSSGGGSLELLTAGDGTYVDLDYKILNDQGAPYAITNDEMSYNIIGAPPGAAVMVVLDGNAFPSPIAHVGANGQAHAWLSASGVANYLAGFDPSWNDDDYTQKPAVAQFLVDSTPVATRTLRITKTTSDLEGGGGAPADQLYVTTAGGNDNVVHLDLNVYRETTDHIMTNDEMSYNIFGATPGHQVKAKIEGFNTSVLAMVGVNGEAHGWISAAGIADFLNDVDPSWDDDSYVGKPAIIQFFIDDGAGGETLVAPAKTAQVTKVTTTSGSPGTQVLELITTGGPGDLVDLDIKIFRDATGDHTITNDEMSYDVLGATPGWHIKALVNGSATNALAIVGQNGEAHGWLSAEGIANFLVGSDPTWGDDDYLLKQATVQFFMDDGAGGAPTNINPAKTIRVTKETVIGQSASQAESIAQEGEGLGRRDLLVYDSATTGYPIDTTEIYYAGRNFTPGAVVQVVLRGTSRIVDMGVTNANGDFIGNIDAMWLHDWGYSDLYTGWFDLYVGGALKKSTEFQYRHIPVG